MIKGITYGDEFIIRKAANKLAAKYPLEANYNSRSTLWDKGLDDGSVTRELYNKAETFYGRLWHYTGD
jgi:hypothetical protein